ncbi:hypothetical protein LTS10_006403 [Elasticomyces elasticus]|nr:hypothetical protein LTS10_006403 [Elasticomyces elasticus]
MVNSNASYYALSGFWYNSDSAPYSNLETDRAGMVHESITLPATDGGQLWSDGGSGAQDDANVRRVYYGPDDDDSIRILQLPDGQPKLTSSIPTKTVLPFKSWTSQRFSSCPTGSSIQLDDRH